MRLSPLFGAVAALSYAIFANGAAAHPPQVVGAKLHPSGDTWRVDATLEHADTGWDHYADGWRVETEDGDVLGTRELLHPHVDEQPFTRSLTGVDLPDGTGQVYVRARCNVDGWADDRLAVPLD